MMLGRQVGPVDKPEKAGKGSGITGDLNHDQNVCWLLSWLENTAVPVQIKTGLSAQTRLPCLQSLNTSQSPSSQPVPLPTHPHPGRISSVPPPPLCICLFVSGLFKSPLSPAGRFFPDVLLGTSNVAGLLSCTKLTAPVIINTDNSHYYTILGALHVLAHLIHNSTQRRLLLAHSTGVETEALKG